jgi:alanine racemase
VLRDAGVECDVYGPGADARLLDDRFLDETSGPDAGSPRDLGAGVYGLDPSAPVPTTAVMTLRAEVIAVKRVRAGTGVSYGYTYRAPDDTSIALVSIGYADGVPRLGSNTAEAELSGTVHRVVGRIAMDQLVLDIGRSPARAGDVVTIFGDRERGLPTAIDWAVATRRSPLALTAGLGRRVVRTHS